MMLTSMLALAGIVGSQTADRTSAIAVDRYPSLQDYAQSWWADGWRGTDPSGRRVLAFQTGHYGMTIDPEHMQLLALGPLSGASYESAAREVNSAVRSLGEASLTITARVRDQIYHVVRAAQSIKKMKDYRDYANYPIRLIEGGRYLQRWDILELEFVNDLGEKLDAVGRLEIVVWPDRVSFVAHINLDNAFLSIRLKSGSKTVSGIGHPFAGTRDFVPPGQVASVSYYPRDGSVDEEAQDVIVSATNLNAPVKQLKADFDPLHGWLKVHMDETEWDEASDVNRLDQIRVSLENPSSKTKIVRLLFERDQTVGGLTGMVPMIRSVAGVPTGIPMQVSKCWPKAHEKNDIEYSPWARHITVLHLPPHSKTAFEFDVTYGMWGGIPGASQDQLCLIGWGFNGAWDVAALGCWGESICYEAEMSQDRGFIDDFRPVLVWSNSGSKRKWFWTNNVGGGDLLVYIDPSGLRQHFARVRTAFLEHGPNLTHVLYAGDTQDGNIQVSIDTRTPRSDDINRAVHHIRYDVLKRTPFSRLAFYQLGADRYNDSQFNRLAMGTENGLTEEWSFKKGGSAYARKGIQGLGATNWVSLHEAVYDPKAGPSANRGLIVRSWKARLGGKDVPRPFFSFFGTEDQRPSMNVELSPPPGLTELLPGDYVDATVEVLTMPMFAADYYGPNKGLREALRAGENTWKPILREAAEAAVTPSVSIGRLVGTLPIEVAVDKDRAAVTLLGGLAFIPIRFSGLQSCNNLKFFLTQSGKRAAFDQSTHGQDFWQADRDPIAGTWTVTLNVPANESGDRRITVELTGGS
ncbi:MAG: hypothetical protein P4L46_23000 [Fimbriimonas sp.]|nr:hypothetical protein [Fimbriimonas sp.]